MEAAEDSGAVEIEWLPFELRPAPRPLLEVRGDHLRVDWTQNVYRRALALGIEIHLPRYQPRSTLTLARVPLGRRAGPAARLQARALRGVLLRGRATSRPTARSRRAAERAGLDPDGAVAAAYSPERVERSYSEIRREAEAAGVRGVPSLLTEDGEHHWGMGGLERLLAGEPLVPASRWSRGPSDAGA